MLHCCSGIYKHSHYRRLVLATFDACMSIAFHSFLIMEAIDTEKGGGDAESRKLLKSQSC